MPNVKKLLIITSGGDSPGMNAGIRAIVRMGIAHHIEMYGSVNGFYGLIHQNVKQLTPASVANCIQRGGTILKTGRCPEFKEKSVRDKARDYLKQLEIDAIIVLGGNGSFTGAQLLATESADKQHAPQVIGIPCTIDNDIIGTDYCIGFDTARNTALQAIDKIRDTAFSLDSNFLIEVMGRETGFLAVDVGIAGGAEIILTPEFPMTTEALVEMIQHKKRKKLASIIVVAESNRPGYSLELAEKIKAMSGISYKVCILGHTQRGGTPTVMDRKIGTVMGAKALEAIQHGETGKMLACREGEIQLVDFPEPNSTRFFKDKTLLQMNEKICKI